LKGVKWTSPYPINGQSFFGLISGTNAALNAALPTSHPQLNFAFFLWGTNKAVREADNQVPSGSFHTGGTSWTGQTFELRIVSSGCSNSMSLCVKYVLDGNVLFTSYSTVTYPLHVGAQMGDGNGGTYNNIQYLTADDAATW